MSAPLAACSPTMSDIPGTEPTTIRAGDGVQWRRSLPEHLATDGWVLKYRVLRAVPPHRDITAAADGADHLVSLSATTTAAWQAGRATLVGWAEKAATGERETLLQQSMDVLPDLTAATSLDGRTAAQRRLADAEAALSAYLAGGQGHVAEYVINGRRMVFREARELQDLVDGARRDVARENARAAAAQGYAPGRIYTRF